MNILRFFKNFLNFFERNLALFSIFKEKKKRKMAFLYPPPIPSQQVHQEGHRINFVFLKKIFPEYGATDMLSKKINLFKDKSSFMCN